MKDTILKNISFKKVIPWVAVGLVAILLALLPVITSKEETSDVTSVIKNEQASTRDIDTVLIGGGQIESSGVYDLEIPEDVKIKEFLVSNGDTVSKGDPIAVVDPVSAMAAITGIQESIDELADDIEWAELDETTTYITSSPGGRVKKVYAQVGDSVEDVMLEYGTLAIISLDDTMGVTIEAETSYMPGDKVSVKIGESDDTVTGRIKTNASGKLTLTVEDNKYEIGDVASVYDADNKLLGKGMLYVYNPWNATGSTGTVTTVYITEGSKVSAGKTLFAITRSDQSSDYQQALDKMQKYESFLADVFKIYSKGYIEAPCDGVVSGIDTSGTFMLSYNPESNNGTGSGYKVVLLTNDVTPTISINGSFISGTKNSPYNAMFSATLSGAPLTGTWSATGLPNGLIMDPASGTVYGTPTDANTYSVSITFTPTGGQQVTQNYTLYIHDPATPTPTPPVTPTPNPQYFYAYAAQLSFVKNGQIKGKCASTPITITSVSELGNKVPSVTTDFSLYYPGSEKFSVGDVVWIVRDKDNNITGIYPSGISPAPSPSPSSKPSGGGTSSGGSGGGGGASGMTVTVEGDGLYSTEKIVVASVTSQEEMTVSISIDELDITKVYVGQTAMITMNSFAEEPVEAVVTNISNSGENSGGNSKFTVSLKLGKTTEMLPGMNATATITLDSAKNVLSVPSAAISSLNGKKVVYTSYNEKDKTFENPVEVETGVADANYVQILSGLSEGSTVYYEVFETVGYTGQANSL